MENVSFFEEKNNIYSLIQVVIDKLIVKGRSFKAEK